MSDNDDDVTDRLRAITVAEEIEECLLPDELVTLAEAADEIDRLRAEVERLEGG